MVACGRPDSLLVVALTVLAVIEAKLLAADAVSVSKFTQLFQSVYDDDVIF